MKQIDILGIDIAATDMKKAVEHLQLLIDSGPPSYVVFAAVHGVMECQRDDSLRNAFNGSGMTLPDGMPLVWAGWLQGCKDMGRVYGPALMLEMARLSLEKGYTHFLYGGKKGVAERLKSFLETRFPGIRILGTWTPPFRPLEKDEREALLQHVSDVRPDLFWVGLGTPKQERFMAEFVGRLEAKLMLGVGAAFDFHTGTVKEAPRWIMKMGLQWLFRLTQEPGRLWKRYAYNNPLFLIKYLDQTLKKNR